MKNSLCFHLSPSSLLTGVVAFSMLTLVGCGDDDPPTPQTPTSGSIFGSVALYDELGMDIDDANMTMTVEGMSRSATTDINGDFTIENVPLGTHNLVFL